MLIDLAEIVLCGGRGGSGITSFGRMAHSGPDGGNGGKGGDIYLIAESDLTLLNQFSRKKYFEAEAGTPGGKNKRTGKNGNDLELKVPIGTLVIEKNTNKTLAEFTKKGQRELICEGGLGGRGNYEFRSPTRTTPEISESGKKGEKKEVILNLRLIADFGLVGLPNAGKSSLLNELTRANAKTANYPFTTLSPNLGSLNGKIIADIPGLIKGASEGRGLGVRFLKHIEKVRVILHCISSDSVSLVDDYITVRSEMKQYNKTLLKKKEIILLTKSDLVEKGKLDKMKKLFKKYSSNIIPISIHDWESIEKLKSFLNK